MKFKQRILYGALCLMVLALAVSSEASITIKGKNLDEIDDIVGFATNSGKPEMKKYSLGVMQFRPDFQDIRRTFHTEKIDENGTPLHAQVHFHVPEPGEGGNENSMMYSAASSLRPSESKYSYQQICPY